MAFKQSSFSVATAASRRSSTDADPSPNQCTESTAQRNSRSLHRDTASSLSRRLSSGSSGIASARPASEHSGRPPYTSPPRRNHSSNVLMSIPSAPVTTARTPATSAALDVSAAGSSAVGGTSRRMSINTGQAQGTYTFHYCPTRQSHCTMISTRKRSRNKPPCMLGSCRASRS